MDSCPSSASGVWWCWICVLLVDLLFAWSTISWLLSLLAYSSSSRCSPLASGLPSLLQWSLLLLSHLALAFGKDPVVDLFSVSDLWWSDSGWCAVCWGAERCVCESWGGKMDVLLWLLRLPLALIPTLGVKWLCRWQPICVWWLCCLVSCFPGSVNLSFGWFDIILHVWFISDCQVDLGQWCCAEANDA